jgi:hypothetical protein
MKGGSVGKGCNPPNWPQSFTAPAGGDGHLRWKALMIPKHLRIGTRGLRIDRAPAMRINITLDVAPEELPLATELLAVLR